MKTSRIDGSWAVAVGHMLALPLILSIASLAAWGTPLFWTIDYGLPLVGMVVLAHASSAVLHDRLVGYPGVKPPLMAVACTAGSYVATLAILATFRGYYSLSFLGTAGLFGAAANWLLGGLREGTQGRVMVVQGGVAELAARALGIEDAGDRADGPVRWVLVDLHATEATGRKLAADAALGGAQIIHAAAVVESALGRLSPYVTPDDVAAGFELRKGYLWPKRVFELLASLALLPILAPVALLVALAIRVETKGSVLFVQERVGRHGKPFRMYKFRTMIPGATAEARYATADADRITTLGRVLRRFRLDELPQLVNVLKGDMSLIGPRPEQVPLAREFERELPGYPLRHLVAPGISGWAQVSHGYAANEIETRVKLEHDLYYIKHFSFWIDLLIVVRTLRTVLTGFGSK